MSIRRALAASENPAYDTMWASLAERAGDLGAHAWRFRSAGDPHAIIEFIEFRDDGDPRNDPAFTDVLDRLNSIARGADEEWIAT